MRSFRQTGRMESCAANPAAPQMLQLKPRIGPASDPLEHEADRVADAIVSNQVLSAGAVSVAATGGVQRECADCEARERDEVRLQRDGQEEDEEIQLKPDAPSTVGSEGATAAVAAVSDGGAPLPPVTRSYFEPRFGRDLSSVRIHTHSRAQRAAAAIGARAYTHGRDIGFAQGEYAPQSREGRHLLAHELTHVIQQRRRPAESDGTVRRRLVVEKPTASIPDPTGKGVKQTNSVTIEQYLSKLCSEGAPKVDKAGDVVLSSGLCSKEIVGPNFMGPLTAKQERVKTETGCTCLCDMIASKNLWKISVDDVAWPHTSFNSTAKANKKGSGGSGGSVTAPSPNSQKLWGATTKSGVDLNIDPWLVLGHELCGHAWLGDRGEHAADKVKPRGSGGHQATVARENLIRQEHGIEERGGYRDPFCGESFFRDKAKPGVVIRSSFMKECERWRKEYNKKHGTKYTLKDRIPP